MFNTAELENDQEFKFNKSRFNDECFFKPKIKGESVTNSLLPLSDIGYKPQRVRKISVNLRISDRIFYLSPEKHQQGFFQNQVMGASKNSLFPRLRRQLRAQILYTAVLRAVLSCTHEKI